MITLTPSDYMIISMVFLALALRIIGDVRDILEAKFIKNVAKLKGKRNFSPRLTIVIPFDSLENTRQTLEHLSKSSFSSKVIVIIDSKIHSRYTSSLRYFVRKHSMKRVKVISRKSPSLAEIAAEYAKTGLVIILPDTCRVQESFYSDAILPFGDKTVDALQLMPSVRTDKTLGSGIQVLFTAWRRYIGINGIRRSSTVPGGSLPEGMVMRAKFLRKTPKRLNVVSVRRPAYSVSAESTTHSVWSKLQKSAGVADYGAALVISASTLLMVILSRGSTVTFGVYMLLYVLVVWWSLSAARVALVDQISIVLLSPFFFIFVISFMIAGLVHWTARLIKIIKANLTRIFVRSRAATN